MELKTKNYRLKTTQGGLTLVEIMVATALFSIVMLVAVGAVISINDSNKRAQLSRTVMDNLNFAMENMARNLRMGTVYHCGATGAYTSPADCPAGENTIAFEGYKGSASDPDDQIVYRLSGGRIERSLASGGAGSFLPLTSEELTITSLAFYVTGTAAGDGKQPRVTISVSGTASFKGTVSTFTIQTGVSQRRLDS
ncbi:MAG: prepilin-type N-terminal cleavage/methylation domain-containing protein [bacterium]|nr:prepilin-type N-terminal cleavage/methylation domain-containing protein [bacterium]